MATTEDAIQIENLQLQTEAEYDSTVRADIEQFRAHAEKFVAGEITDDQFRAQRLRRGIYGQRQPGVQMIRTKIPGGILTAGQMDQLALIADEFGGGKGHLTTRQNIQYHFVPLLRVPPLLHMLADVRMTTREACYNTVRNVTACPLSGLLEDEAFDVQPYARKVAFVETSGLQPLYEFTWNHTTLHAIRIDPTITYLQLRFPPANNLELVDWVAERFRDEVLLHLEFQRRFGKVRKG